MKEILRYGFILGFICFLASAVLSVVNGITEPKIQAQRQMQEESAMNEVLPEVINFKPHYQGEKIIYYSAFDSLGRLKGFLIKAEAKGYSSNIETLVGLDLKLEIIQIKILSQNETPGLGNRILEASFRNQFKDKNLDSFEQIQAITGATISSAAVINTVKNKILELKDQLLKEISYGG